MPKFKTHVFICTNGTPDQQGKCNSKGADILHANVKAAYRSLVGDIRINKSCCLGHCEFGIATVIYPNSDWNLELTPNSTEQLVEIIQRAHSQNSKIL